MTEDHRLPEPPSGPSPQDDAERQALQDLIPAYALGTTDPDETKFVERMLAKYPMLIYELEVYREMRRALVFSAPEVQTPAAAKSRILGNLLASTAPTAAALPQSAVTTTAAPTSMPARTASAPAAASGGWLDRLWRMLGGSADTPPLLRLSPILAAAAIVLLVASNLYWSGQINQLRDQQAQLVALTTQQNTLMTLVSTGDVYRAQLAPTADGSGSETVSVVWTPDAEVAVLYAQQLPALAPDQTYQVWFIRGDQPVSAGLLQVGQDGMGSLVLTSPEPVGSFDVIGITVEPSTGSQLPTSAPIAAGELQA